MGRFIGPCFAMLAMWAATSVARAEVVDSRALAETLRVSPDEEVTVIVDNVFGRVAVTGSDGNEVEMHATETVRGDLRGDIDRAHAEIELNVEQEPGRIAFRVRRKDGCDCRNQHWDGYVVSYDIELKVPRRAAVDLSTVNEGDVVVTGVHGNFDLANVNGDVEVAFPDDVSANLDFESFRGDVFTDFEIVSVGAASTPAATGRGLRLLSKPRSARFRVGAGGPTYSFNTLNGDIYVRKVNQ